MCVVSVRQLGSVSVAPRRPTGSGFLGPSVRPCSRRGPGGSAPAPQTLDPGLQVATLTWVTAGGAT